MRQSSCSLLSNQSTHLYVAVLHTRLGCYLQRLSEGCVAGRVLDPALTPIFQKLPSTSHDCSCIQQKLSLAQVRALLQWQQPDCLAFPLQARGKVVTLPVRAVWCRVMGIADCVCSLAAMQVTLTMTASAGSRHDTEVVGRASRHCHTVSEPTKEMVQSVCAMLPGGHWPTQLKPWLHIDFASAALLVH